MCRRALVLIYIRGGFIYCVLFPRVFYSSRHSPSVKLRKETQDPFLICCSLYRYPLSQTRLQHCVASFWQHFLKFQVQTSKKSHNLRDEGKKRCMKVMNYFILLLSKTDSMYLTLLVFIRVVHSVASGINFCNKEIIHKDFLCTDHSIKVKRRYFTALNYNYLVYRVGILGYQLLWRCSVCSRQTKT